MPNQLIADMNSSMAALQIVLNLLSAVALSSLAIYLIGIALLCLSERHKRSVNKTTNLKPATGYPPARPLSSAVHIYRVPRIRP